MLPLEKIKSMDSDKKASFLKLITEKGEEYGVYPLSMEQKSIWFLYKRDLGKDDLYYNIRFAISVSGKVSRDELVNAVERTVDADPILKARFFEIGYKVFQYVAKDEKCYIIFEKEHMNGIFDLETEGPFKCCITENEKGFLLDIAVHHISADGFSVGVFFEDFKKALANENISKEGISYFDYCLAQQTDKMKEKRKKCIAYWKNKLSNAGQIVTFPTDIPRKDYKPMPSKSKIIDIDGDTASVIKSIIMKNRLTSYSFYLAVIANILRTFGRTGEIIFASSYLNRNDAIYKDMIGIRANMLVQRVYASADEDFFDTAQRIQKDMFEGIGYMDIGIDEMFDCFDKVNIEGFRPCYQVLYSIRKSKHYISEESSLNRDINAEFIMENGDGADRFDYDMSFSVYEYEDKTDINLSYHSGLYSDEKAQMIADAVKRSIKLITENDGGSCGEYIPKDFESYSLELKEKADKRLNEELSKAVGCHDVYSYNMTVDDIGYCVLYYTGEPMIEPQEDLKNRYGILIPVYVDCMPYDTDGEVNIRMLRLMYDEQVRSLINACGKLISSGYDKENITVIQTDISKKISKGELFSVCREAVKGQQMREYYFFGCKKTYLKLKQKYHSLEYRGAPDNVESFLKNENNRTLRIFVEADESTELSQARKYIKDNVRMKVFYNDLSEKEITDSMIVITGDGTDPVTKMTDELFSCENYAGVSYLDGMRTVCIRNGTPTNTLRYTIKSGKAVTADAVDMRSIYDSIGSSFITISSQDSGLSDGMSNALSETEQTVLDIWKKNLGSGDIGIYDKLFEIGGNSYICMNILNDLTAKGYTQLKITDLFSYNSVYALSAHLDSISDDRKNESISDVTDLMF